MAVCCASIGSAAMATLDLASNSAALAQRQTDGTTRQCLGASPSFRSVRWP